MRREKDALEEDKMELGQRHTQAETERLSIKIAVCSLLVYPTETNPGK